MAVQPGVLSLTTAVGLSTAWTACYVASVYLLPATRVTHLSYSAAAPPNPNPNPSSEPTDSSEQAETAPTPIVDQPRDRNHTSIIKARLSCVSLVTVLSAVSAPHLINKFAINAEDVIKLRPHQLLGMSLPANVVDAARLVVVPLGLTMSLFAGSLYVTYLAQCLPGQRWWSSTSAWLEFGGWQGLRNLILGPLTEEVVFRSCIVPVSALAGMSKTQIVFLTPLYFGLAHAHHAYETYVAGGKTRQALIRGLLQTTFQFTYTTLFGWYATFLFLRTGSIIPPFLAHSFCNLMGLPPLVGALRQWPDKKLSLWSTYAAGIATFAYGFWRWTEPVLFGGSVYWS